MGTQAGLCYDIVSLLQALLGPADACCAHCRQILAWHGGCALIYCLVHIENAG